MICKKMYSALFYLVVLFNNASCSELITGDKKALEAESFSFLIKEHVQSSFMRNAGAYVYVGAAPGTGGAGNVDNFALSRVGRKSKSFSPFAPKTVTLNGKKDQKNPLFDQGILHLSLFEGEADVSGARERPVVVIENQPNNIFMVNRSSGETGEIFSPLDLQGNEQNVPDASGADTSEILALETANPFVFAAVKPNSGIFGDVGSGIAELWLGIENLSNGTLSAFFAVDAPTGSVLQKGSNKATPLDRTSEVVKIANDLASLGQVVDMHWSNEVNRLYIALQTTAAAGIDDGSKALVIAGINYKTNELKLLSIGPNQIFSGTNKIIGAIGADTQVSIHKVRTTRTSTALDYIVVLGGNGSPEGTRRSVYALPLVNWNEDDSLNGTIANKLAVPDQFYSPLKVSDSQLKVPIFARRAITDPATEESQMTNDTDPAAQVGGGELVNGDIGDMFVKADTVFVSVKDVDGDQLPGLFFSQALFQADGKIKAWTQWRRAGGAVNSIAGVHLDPRTGQFTYLIDNNDSIKTVKRTVWSQGDPSSLLSVNQAVDIALPQQNGGVQSVFNFPINTPGLLNISLLVLGGNKTIFLAQTGLQTAGVFIPTGNSFGQLERFNNGGISKDFPVDQSKMIAIESGALDQVGPVVAAEIARDSQANQAWLFVGGTNGLAVLSNEDGTGWDATTGLSDGFAGLVDGMAFKLIEGYSFVRKIMADDQFLYVLTDKKLDRIDVTQSTIGLGQVSAQTIASIGFVPNVRLNGRFLDFIVSEKLVLLATDTGIVQNVNDIRNISDDISAGWKRIVLPESVPPVRQLIAYSQTGRPQDVARGLGGQVYLLNAYRGENQSRLYRLAINSVENSAIKDDTVQLFPDLFVGGLPSYFLSFGVFRNLFYTDGALNITTRSQEGAVKPSARLLFTGDYIRSGVIFAGVSFDNIPVDFATGTQITGLTQNFASGTWLLAGDFGLRFNE